MRIEKRKLEELKAAEYNPREDLQPSDAEYQKIKCSIQKFGYVDPIIINSDGTIIGGHQRVKVMRELGYDEIDTVVVELNKTDEKALNIALNKISGNWDEAKLKDVLLELKLDEFDISLTGFNNDEFENLLNKFSIEQANDDDYNVEENLEKITTPQTKYGDIWQLGRHFLMCGDSTNQNDIKKLMAGSQVDLIITDPPYNVDYGGKNEFLNKYLQDKKFKKVQPIKNDKMETQDFYEFINAAFKAMYNVSHEGTVIYVFYGEHEVENFIKAFKTVGWKLSQNLIWEKNHFVISRQDYHYRHEPILYGWREGKAHYFIADRTKDTIILEEPFDYEKMSKRDLIEYINKINHECKTTVLYADKMLKNDLHPTMKPIELIGTLIKNSSKINQNILDPFGGSGSTLIAAEQLNRNAYLCELDERYCDVIKNRWEEFTGKKAVKINV